MTSKTVVRDRSSGVIWRQSHVHSTEDRAAVWRMGKPLGWQVSATVVSGDYYGNAPLRLP